VVQRREGRTVLVDLDRTVGILPAEEQIQSERYRPGERIKIYVKQVNLTPKGPEIILSRTTEEILRKVFYLEIPEISNGLVEIKAVAREAGSRSKVAVTATSENVDPIGSCVGQRGARIQTIIAELGGEKIDIIEYDEDSARFIANALAPAKVINVDINERDKKALVKVKEDQLSLAIGRDGQNVRLAARLTGWRLDIVGDKQESKKTIKQESKEEEEGKEGTSAGSVQGEEGEMGEEVKKKDKGEEVKSGEENKKENKIEKVEEGTSADSALQQDSPQAASLRGDSAEPVQGEEVKQGVQEIIQNQGEKAEEEKQEKSETEDKEKKEEEEKKSNK
jgi:N utilization substance protein A